MCDAVADAHGAAWQPDSASFLAAAPGLHAAAVRLLAAADRKG